MKKIAISLLFLLAFSLIAGAQKKMKPWTEWTEKDAIKVLNDSPWGQTQTETNTSEMFYSPGSRNTNEGAYNQATSINYRIRLLSSKPIRLALARLAELKNAPQAEQLKAFAEQQTDQYIVVAVDYDSTDRRISGPAMQALNSSNTALLKNNTYLETKDGKRLFLQEYLKPNNDGMGAKFVFPRTLDGQPFVVDGGNILRFYSEVSRNLKLNMRFKISDLLYEGRLEY
ncbi:MAG: hypothetical protein L0220_09520 [Acidobacteria bacterium]|nr:hypothetical protein [Acidobacteriota bacterium]